MVGAARHGIAAPRGQALLPQSRGGRFGRLFEFLPRRDPGADAIERLAAALQGVAGNLRLNTRVPAGYTYLGQFVDHDITFDPTSQLQRDNDPQALADFRTPRFDLDSLYGSGPADQPFLYDWSDAADPGVKLLVGSAPPDARFAALDLPRNQQGRALVGDARNDENLILAQLHLLFIRFHNRVVDHLRSDRLRGAELFEEAQRLVRWHYQWIVMHDFMPKIAGEKVARAVFSAGAGGPTIERRYYAWRDEPFVPVEFSAAAFRLGHSMVRHSYRLNAHAGNVQILRPEGEPGSHLGGFRRLPAGLRIEWEHFFETGPPTAVQPSMRIDASLATPLFALPPDGASLARLNLQRGRALGLPAGADVAHAMGESSLSDDELLTPLVPAVGEGSPAAEPALDDGATAALLHATPLWYYVLCEARSRGEGGLHLGPVGGRIVAEVLAGLLEADPSSYLRQWPAWRPGVELDRPGDGFGMVDLVRFVEAA